MSIVYDYFIISSACFILLLFEKLVFLKNVKNCNRNVKILKSIKDFKNKSDNLHERIYVKGDIIRWELR